MFKNFFNRRGNKETSASVKKTKKASSEWTPHQPGSSPEELCGIEPSTMTKEAIRKRLAILYRRHNNAAGSLRPELRKEAAEMLVAIVECREKYVDSE